MNYLSKALIICFCFMTFSVFSDDAFKPEDALILKEFKANKTKRNALAYSVIRILSGHNIVAIAGPLKKGISQKQIIASLGTPDVVRGDNKYFHLVYYCGKDMDGDYLNLIFASYPERSEPFYMCDGSSNVPYKISVKGYDKILEYKLKLYNKIIDKIKKRELPISNGIVLLPEKFNSASSSRKIFASETNQGLQILFRTWRGKSVNMRGFLYAEQDIKLSNSKDSDKTYNIIGQPYNIVKKMNNNWYYVTWSLE